MNKKLSRVIGSTCICASLISISPVTVSAVSVMNKGAAGVGTALPQDALAATRNPAASAFVPCSLDAAGKCKANQVELGMMFIIPLRGYTAEGLSPHSPFAPGSYTSDGNLFILPSLGLLHAAPDSSFAYSVSLYADGIETDYAHSVVSGGSSGFELTQTITNINMAWRFKPQGEKFNFSLGASVLLALQNWKAAGLAAFSGVSASPQNLSDNGDDYRFGAGAQLGSMVKFHDFSFGINYQSKIKMGKHKKYSGLLPNGGELDIPARGSLGIAYQFADYLTLGMDVEHIWLSDVAAYSNPIAFPPNAPPLGATNAGGFGLNDPTIYKFAVIVKATKDLIFRAGYAYNNQMINVQSIAVAPLIPVTTQHRITLGSTLHLNENLWISSNVLYGPKKTVSGAIPASLGGGTMSVHLEEFAFGLALGAAF